MTDAYTKDLEERVEKLETDVETWRNIATSSSAFESNIPKRKKWFFFNKKTPELQMILDYNARGPYGYDGKSKKKDLRRLIEYLNEPHHGEKDYYVAISTKFMGVHFPMWDCDSEDDYENIKKYLAELKTNFITIESSKDHYWVLADIPKKKFKDAFHLVKSSGAGDVKHTDLSWRRKMFTMRGFNRGSHSLEFVEYGSPYLINDNYREMSWVFNEFTEKLMEYFGEDIMGSSNDSFYPEIFERLIGEQDDS